MEHTPSLDLLFGVIQTTETLVSAPHAGQEAFQVFSF